jgi:hypothetical protein
MAYDCSRFVVSSHRQSYTIQSADADHSVVVVDGGCRERQ